MLVWLCRAPWKWTSKRRRRTTQPRQPPWIVTSSHHVINYVNDDLIHVGVVVKGSLEVDLKAEEADNTAAAAPADRLILAVHGIGQKLSKASIVDDAAAMRALVPTSIVRTSRVYTQSFLGLPVLAIRACADWGTPITLMPHNLKPFSTLRMC